MGDFSATQLYFKTRNTCHRDVCLHLSSIREKINGLSEHDSFWLQELEKVRKEKDVEWQERLNEIIEENRKMRKQLQRTNNNVPEFTDKNIQIDEGETEVDTLNRRLALQLITINKLQNDLAQCTKVIFELEKSYALHCLKTLNKGGKPFL